MKREMYIFAAKSSAIILSAVFLIAAIPKISSAQSEKAAQAVAFPIEAASSLEEKLNSKSKKDKSSSSKSSDTDSEDDEKTTKKASSDEDTSEAQKLASEITDTPSDIKALMDKAQSQIKKEKKVGKTSEASYFGGGTLVKSSGVEYQSKIPESFYKINAKKLLKEKADLSIADPTAPTVLIYHTHTTEAYSLLDLGYYTGSLDTRSSDSAKNMVRVGDEICKYLNAYGINTVHDTEIHDENYTAAYKNSRKTVLSYLEKYPTIDITIDVHRDDITYDNKTKVKPTVKINGKKAARMMLIAGAEYGSVENYPDWEYNLRFVTAVQNKVSSLYPSLMRPILFAERKYNMDVTHNSFLLEIGTDANTLDEAAYSARLFATALAELLKEDYIEK